MKRKRKDLASRQKSSGVKKSTIVAVAGIPPDRDQIGSISAIDAKEPCQLLVKRQKDETARKRNRKALKASELRYRTLFENMPHGIYQTTPDGRILTANPALVQMLGYNSESELLAADIVCDLYANPEDRKAWTRRIQEGGEVRDAELVLRCKDGRERTCLESGHVVRDEQGRILYYEGIMTDITERKRMEGELRQSEERYRLITENMAGSVWLMDMNLKPIYISPNNTRVRGYTLEELYTLPINRQLTPDSLKLALQNFKKALAAEKLNLKHERRSVTEELEFYRKDGSTFWSENTFSFVRNSKGEPTGILGVGRDITDRKRAEDELRRRAEELTALQETVLDITGRHDLSELLESIVERAVRLLGATGGGMYLCDSEKKEVRCAIGYNTATNVVGTVIKFGEGAAGIVAMTGKPLIIDDYRTWPGRAAVYEKDRPFTSVISAPMVWEGQVMGVIHVLDKEVRHFTQADLELLTLFANHAAIAIENARYSENLERTVAERTAKLADSEHQLHLIADSLPATISYVDPQQRYRFNNKTYEEWFGQSPNEIVGRHVREILGENSYERIHERIEAALSGQGQSFEYDLTSRSGTRHINVTYVPDFGEQGHVKGVFVLGIDITERKRMEERLVKAERLAAIGETAAMVAHDLRNPLQGIIGAVHVLRKESLTDKQKDEMLQVIQDSVHYSDAIVRDLTEYSREIHLEPMETTPKSIITDAVRIVRIPEKITFHDLSQEHPKITVDQDKMRRAIVNLIENAIEAMPQGGALTIRSKQFDRVMEIALSDTGSGVPENVMKNLWKPLQTSKAKGLGLGLPICKRIVDAHGGTISVDSKTDQGTTVTIRLPLTDHALEVNEK